MWRGVTTGQKEQKQGRQSRSSGVCIWLDLMVANELTTLELSLSSLPFSPSPLSPSSSFSSSPTTTTITWLEAPTLGSNSTLPSCGGPICGRTPRPTSASPDTPSSGAWPVSSSSPSPSSSLRTGPTWVLAPCTFSSSHPHSPSADDRNVGTGWGRGRASVSSPRSSWPRRPRTRQWLPSRLDMIRPNPI
jgi:hypothetical protein